MPPKKRSKTSKVESAESFENGNIPTQLVNGLADALGLPQQFIGTQLSQLSTLFANNRWQLISNNRQLLTECYVEHGIIQTLVDTPVNDGLRGGLDIKTKQLEPDQIKELQNWMEREEDLLTVGQAASWNRLFGGAGVLIMTGQDHDTPLDISQIRKGDPVEFRDADLWELFYDKQQAEGFNPATSSPQFEYYNYYGQRVHRSRVLRLKGLKAPSFIRPRMRGWGFSTLEGFVQSVNQFLKSKNVVFEILDELKLDIYKFKGLNQTLLSGDGTAKVQQRTQIANQGKNFNNAIVMDADDIYEQKSLALAGLAEMKKEFRIDVAADMRFPMTKLFGLSASGFNSGEDDIEVYNAMVESTVRTKVKRPLIKVVELRCQQLYGFVPTDLEIAFKPLRVLSSEQEETVKEKRFNRLIAARQAGEITSEEFRQACNHDNLLPIQLDESVDMQEEQDETQDEADQESDVNGQTKGGSD